MIFTKVISTAVEKGVRIAKVLAFGKNDTRTAPEASPYGIDSNPIAGMQAIYGATAANGAVVILGYINTQQLAKTGEFRIYSTDSGGAEKTRIWLHADGSIDLGGTGSASNTKHATQYEALNTQLQSQISKINTELTKIATGITGVGGVYTPTPISVDFSSAKLNNIKTE